MGIKLISHSSKFVGRFPATAEIVLWGYDLTGRKVSQTRHLQLLPYSQYYIGNDFHGNSGLFLPANLVYHP